MYLIIEGENDVRREPKTYTDIEMVRLAGHTIAEARGLSSTRRKRITVKSRENFMI